MTQSELGKVGELLAEKDYVKDGYITIEKNYRTRAGEIDLIVTHGSSLIFSEVKARKNDRMGAPREAVGYKKQARIIKAAQEFLANNPAYNEFVIRFDVVEILCKSKDNYELTRIQNAFEAQ